MRLIGLGHGVPSRSFDNEHVVRLYRERCDGGDDAVWRGVERDVRAMLAVSGARGRHLSSDGETAYGHGCEAARHALQDARLEPGDIDLLIYASVSRGWLEPSMACGFQEAIGCSNASSFDVVDACASWLRAMQIAASLLDGGQYRRAMILCVESGMYDFVRFNLADTADRSRFLASCTLGEAAAATIVEAGDGGDFYSVIKTFGKDRSLCSLPLANYREFVAPDAPPLEPAGFFQAQSAQLVKRTAGLMVATFEQDDRLRGRDFDIGFSHAVSNRAGQFVGNALKWPKERFYQTFEEFGNVVAATVPLAMSVARRRGILETGDRCMVAIGSAGITVGFASFTFGGGDGAGSAG